MSRDDELREMVEKALDRAFSLGQTYWQQADSEYASQWKKADETRKKFNDLCNETAALLTRTEAAPVADGAVAWVNQDALQMIQRDLQSDRPRMACVRAWNTDYPSDGATLPLYTHPHDASARDAALRLLFSPDLYGMLMDVQNGIDSPASASIANSLIRRIDAARDAAMSAAAREQTP